MLSLMLDRLFKSLSIISFFIGCGEMSILLRNMIENLYILCFWNVIIICIQWQNAKLHVKNKKMTRIPIWIFLNKLPTQVNHWKNMFQRNCWFWHNTKWIPRKLGVIFNGWEDMKLCFLLLIFFTYQIWGIVRSQIENERIFLNIYLQT